MIQGSIFTFNTNLDIILMESHHNKAGAGSALHSWKFTKENILIQRLSLVLLCSIANSSKSNSWLQC